MSLEQRGAQSDLTQHQFEEMLPDIQAIAAHAFRDLDHEAREEAVEEVVGMAWKNFLHCSQKGKNPGASSLAFYAALGVKSGRRLCGSSCTDVMSKQTHMKGRCSVQNLNAEDRQEAYDRSGRDFSEALTDRRVWQRPPERTRVKLDYQAFLARGNVTDQERQVFHLLAAGWGTGDIAHHLGVSPPRISQVKNSLGKKLTEFFGNGVAHPAGYPPMPASFVATT